MMNVSIELGVNVTYASPYGTLTSRIVTDKQIVYKLFLIHEQRQGLLTTRSVLLLNPTLTPNFESNADWKRKAVMQKFLGSRWPEQLGESWQQQSLAFQAKTHEVALKILRAMALSLGRDEYEFIEVRIRWRSIMQDVCTAKHAYTLALWLPTSCQWRFF